MMLNQNDLAHPLHRPRFQIRRLRKPFPVPVQGNTAGDVPAVQTDSDVQGDEMNKWTAQIPCPTEHDEQSAVVEWAAWHENAIPSLSMLFAIPNGGYRHPAVAGKLKDEGVKPGVPDLFLAAPKPTYHGLFIEMKRKSGSNTPANQRDWHERLTGQGYCVRVCKGADAAIAEIERYLEL